MQLQLARVGIEREIGGAGLAERVREVARAASHVEQSLAFQRRVIADVGGGVLGHDPVEMIRVGLLDPEGFEQAAATPDGRLEWGCHGSRRYRVCVARWWNATRQPRASASTPWAMASVHATRSGPVPANARARVVAMAAMNSSSMTILTPAASR